MHVPGVSRRAKFKQENEKKKKNNLQLDTVDDKRCILDGNVTCVYLCRGVIFYVQHSSAEKDANMFHLDSDQWTGQRKRGSKQSRVNCNEV